ncbi:Acyl-CoA dehydrogenase [Sphingobium faniae]|nr:Acyl-CoA dehydrogenase [Sphingobium faniae]
MELTLNDDQVQFLDTIRRFLGNRAGVEMRHAPTLERRRETWAALAELGLQGVAVPVELGGFSGTPEDIAVIAFELGREPVGTPRYENIVLAARLLGKGSGDAVAEMLGRLVTGDLRPAIAAYERPTCFDLAKSTTRISKADGGYVVNGDKLAVVDGDDANMLLVVGKMEEGGDLAVLAINPASVGVTISPHHLADFTPAANIRFENAFVSEAMLLVSGADASEQLQDCLDEALVILCASTVGSLERAIERTREYLAIREQFGQPLGQFQALQHEVADLFIETNDARSMVYRAMSALHEGREESRRAAAACKVKVMTAARAVTGQALHLHGGIGFTAEYPIGHHFRRAFVDEKLLGDNEYHLERFMAPSGDEAVERAA